MVNSYYDNTNQIGFNNTSNMQLRNPVNQQPYSNNYSMQNYGGFTTVIVQGEAGANAYPVASGNTVMLIDFESEKFWLKSNVNGIPQRLRTFSFHEEIEQSVHNNDNQDITREEFDNLVSNISKISESVNKLMAELGGDSIE